MNRIVHFEICAKNLDEMQKFYESVFGWSIQDLGPQMGNYRIVMTGEDTPNAKWPGINGGMNVRRGDLPVPGQAVNAFVCIVSVDAIDTYIEKVTEAGGTIAMEKMNMPSVGQLAYCNDPEGNLFGMLQPE